MKQGEYVSLYEEIIETYIQCNSPYEINIPDALRKTIQNKHTNNGFDFTIFDEAYDKTEKLFWMNVLIPTMIT